MNATIQKLIPLADAHQKADDYVAGTYGSAMSRKACAVGCTINDARKLKILPKSVANSDHVNLAKATGVPELAWRLCDHIFEGLTDDERSAWPPRFLRAAAKIADTESLPARISARCLRKLAKDAIRDDVRAAAATCAALYKRRSNGDEPKDSEWDAANQQAEAARRQAYAARWQAEAAWQQADAANQQADAAWRQAYAARRQAYAANQQADAARWQAEAAWWQAEAARQQAYAANQQAEAAWWQADAARQAYAASHAFWHWCADMLCEEMERPARKGKGKGKGKGGKHG